MKSGDNMKQIINGILLFGAGVGVLTAGLYLATISLPLGLLLAATSVVPITKSSEEFRGNQIKDSIFSVSKNGNIGQSTLAHPLKMLSILKEKDKNKVFLEETLEMFTQLKDENITYRTRSHAMTLSYLRQLKKIGYIEELNYKPVKKSRLITEKLLIGNIKGIFTKGKSTIYDISFKLTKGKKRDKSELLKIYNQNNPTVTDSKKEEREIIKPISEEDEKHPYIEEKSDNENERIEIKDECDTPHIEEMPEDRKRELEVMLEEANTEQNNQRKTSIY